MLPGDFSDTSTNWTTGSSFAITAVASEGAAGTDELVQANRPMIAIEATTNSFGIREYLLSAAC
jgi:hypothetical protein